MIADFLAPHTSRPQFFMNQDRVFLTLDTKTQVWLRKLGNASEAEGDCHSRYINAAPAVTVVRAIYRWLTANLLKIFFGGVVKTEFVVVALVLLSSGFASAQHDSGSVCVAARVDDPFWKESATLPNGKINSHGLKLKIDKRPVTAWPERKGLKVVGLDTNGRHLLVVLDSGGKPVESVRFRFSEYKSTELCMTYDGYQGIGLQETTRRTPWCKCH